MKGYKGLIIGVIIGALGGWLATKNYYEREYEFVDEEEVDELEEIKKENEEISNRVDTIKKNKEKIMDRKGPRVNVVNDIKDLAPIVLKDGDDACDDYMEIPQENRTDIELIDEDSYDEEYPHFDKIELQYQMEEDVLLDSNGRDELPMSTVGGRGWIDEFRDKKEVFMYVRDHKTHSDYLVEKCSIHDNIPEYQSIASMYNEEKEKIIEVKYERGGNNNGEKKD